MMSKDELHREYKAFDKESILDVITLRGRMGRTEFIINLVAIYFVGYWLGGLIPDQMEAITRGVDDTQQMSLFLLVSFLALFWYNLTIFFKRTRDAGIKPSLAILGIVPFVSLIYTIFLLFKPTKK